MRIAYIHYHAKPGGVTRVMENAIESMSVHPSNIDAVVLCGEKPPEDCRLPCKVVHGLGYSSEEVAPDASTLADRLQAAAKGFLGQEPDVWHIHNHSLGKNPSIADAVVELATRGCRLLLQIHDFAEDGRPRNYRLRENALVSDSCYPVADNIHYAVLNRRDFRILEEAGIPSDKIAWLPNPVIVRELDFDDDSGQNRSLDEVILYPVRAVRRKNLGELLFHASLPSKKRLFVTTLGTTSPDFVDEYQQWKDFSMELGLHVNFEICESYGLPYDSVIDHSHCVITTSVAEGFGLSFVEPWVFGKTLVGRDLPEITTDFKEMGLQFNRLYESIPVPISVFRFDEFRSRLRSMMQSYHESYGVPFDANWMEDWVKSALHCMRIDFAKLDEIAQREVIETVQSDYNLQSTYLDLFSYKLESTQILDSNASIIEQKLSIGSYGKRLITLYEGLMDQPVGGSLTFADTGRILSAFFKVDRFLPLRT